MVIHFRWWLWTRVVSWWCGLLSRQDLLWTSTLALLLGAKSALCSLHSWGCSKLFPGKSKNKVNPSSCLAVQYCYLVTRLLTVPHRATALAVSKLKANRYDPTFPIYWALILYCQINNTVSQIMIQFKRLHLLLGLSEASNFSPLYHIHKMYFE